MSPSGAVFERVWQSGFWRSLATLRLQPLVSGKSHQDEAEGDEKKSQGWNHEALAKGAEAEAALSKPKCSRLCKLGRTGSRIHIFSVTALDTNQRFNLFECFGLVKDD